MTESKADLLLHPIRMRIILALVGKRLWTALQLAEHLSDVPQATLYRHLNKLTKGGIVRVVDKRQVRGATEKVYALDDSMANLTPDDLATATRDDHMRYFMTFVAGLIGDFERYLQQGNVDYVKDGVGYRQVPLYLSDAEFMEFVTELQRVVAGAYSKAPGPGRKRRLLATIMMPVADVPTEEEGK